MSETNIWLVLGLTLVGLELISGSFYLLAIAAGFLAGALAAWLQLPLTAQLVVASAVSLVAVALLRRWKRQQPAQPAAQQLFDIGQRVTVESWQDDTHVRVRYRGSHWDGELTVNTTDRPDELYIVALRGTTLQLSPTPPHGDH